LIVTYKSNNSGGHWWLNDKKWLVLEAAGWTVEWGGSYFCGKPEPHAKEETCHDHRRFDSLAELEASGKDGRWLGAAATSASKDFPSLADAIREWESVVGLDASDEGCNCCGAPHSFSVENPPKNMKYDQAHASGDECARVLLGGPSTYRDALEELARLKKGNS
jgi:hypothetical protein